MIIAQSTRLRRFPASAGKRDLWCWNRVAYLEPAAPFPRPDLTYHWP